MKDLIKILIFIAFVAIVFSFLGGIYGSKIFAVLASIATVLDAFVLIYIVFKKFFL